jgi:PIN domain nuclease of toxin-antitoxin system
VQLLLDTVTFLWFVAGSKDLSRKAKDALRDPANDVFLSSVSAWEIAVKHRLGRLPLPDRPEVWIPEQRNAHAFEALPLDEAAALTLPRLPDLHRDPFDRMLICQALFERLTLVTPDEAVRAYPAPTLW